MSVQTSRSVTSSGTTGSVCPNSGPYRCGSHKEIIVFFKRGDKFSACPAKNHSTTWSVVKESEADDSVSTS